MKETYLYNCEYCDKEFEPKRRRVQKFCSATCRSKHWHHLNSKDEYSTTPTELIETTKEIKPKKKKVKSKYKNTSLGKIDKISTAGIGNAAAGTLAVSLLTTFLTKEKDKPATKGDLAKVIRHIERYQPVENLPFNDLGQKPYFDMETKTIVYKG